MERRKILEKLIKKGGLMGKFAEMYIDDETKSVLFLKECYGHCHTESMKLFWGSELIGEIREFVERERQILKH